MEDYKEQLEHIIGKDEYSKKLRELENENDELRYHLEEMNHRITEAVFYISEHKFLLNKKKLRNILIGE